MMPALEALYRSITACGPVADVGAQDRARDRLTASAAEGGWTGMLEATWPALAPIFGGSPYLATLATRRPDRLKRLLKHPPGLSMRKLISAVADCSAHQDIAAAADQLRRLKGELHLLVAIADLGGLWDLTQVTAALSQFADAAVKAALHLAARESFAEGRLSRVDTSAAGPVPGLFILAMGKHGAFELNYSSDIDISVFYEPGDLPAAEGLNPGIVATRITERVSQLLQSRTSEGYVFRVDLRLRPDPSSTPIAVSVPAAFAYYESVGQNWERAAFIKARVVGGDTVRGDSFLDDLSPFIWRRNLDFAAIADIHAIKRQIHIHKVDDRLTAKGADLKLGRGGIREVEFFVQTQQLILGGRHPQLRLRGTLETLSALAEAGQISRAAHDDMAGSYTCLRAWEHRIQMVNDEQTHRVPESDVDRRRVAALAGETTLRGFDAKVSRVLKRVNRRYGALFAGEEALSSRFGSLIFTGVDDDPETLRTLAKMGFSEPSRISRIIRSWHHGRIGATRTERGREAFTRLAPRLLEAAQATGAPDVAMARFSDFFSRLTAGVQIQSLLLAQPQLLELVVRIMAFAPRFARTLARHPAAMDALLDPGFFGPIHPPTDLADRVANAGGFEASMDVARRAHREDTFRIGVQVLGAVSSATAAGPAFAELADSLISGLARASLNEIERTAGAFSGDCAVIALGKCGSREMTIRSDLDLMTLYHPSKPGAVSAERGLSADTFYARFTQRMVAALSAPTAEGGLYDVDLKLRPSGTKGPVAVSLDAFRGYYAAEAETWELLAMTRARVVWASSPQFAKRGEDAIEAALRRRRDPVATATDVLEMRALMMRERPAQGFWDLKLVAGGLVDIEFCAQYLQLIVAAQGGPLLTNTHQALSALESLDLAPRQLFEDLKGAWILQQDLSQILKIALEDDGAPEQEPASFRTLLVKTGGARTFPNLKARMARARIAAQNAFKVLIEDQSGRSNVF
jgi:[glutamine synthetase] adenylyltransferase / [glutamine synthetase]-adenylyl-L-tyrosine phosphorylase